MRSIALVSALAVLTGCAIPVAIQSAQDTVKIGFLSPLSGADSAFGLGTIKGVQLAVEHINAAGGVNGKQLELLVRDDLGDGTKGVEVANELKAQGVVALVGPIWSGVTQKVVTEVALAAKLPVVSPGSTSPALAKGFADGGLLFRTIPNDLMQAKALSKLLQEEGHSKIAILARGNAYGAALADTLEADFKAQGTVAKIVYADADTVDYAKLKGQIPADVTAVAMIAYSADGTSLLKDWIASGERPTLKFYFSESMKDKNVGTNVNNAAKLEGFKGTAPISEGTYLSAYKSAFKAKFNLDEAPIYSENGYDATMLVALAMVKAGANTSEAVLANLASVASGGVKQTGIGKDGFADAVAKLKAGTDLDYDGASGPVDFDEDGEMKAGSYVIWSWKNGQPVDSDKIVRF